MSEELRPDQVVLDVVLRYTSGMPRMGEATVKAGTLIFTTKNHLGQPLTLSVPVNFDGEPNAEEPRFVLFGIWPGVAKLAPSVKHELFHGFLTIVDVPNG